jgi:hypothetical protein
VQTVRTFDSWILAGAVVVGATAAGGFALAAAGFEAAPTLKAQDAAPPALLKGPKHTLAPTAKGDGFLLSFDVKSEFGSWHAIDLEMLDVRVKEVYSLAQLSDVSKTEIFATAFAKAAADKAKAVANVVKDPVGTAKAVPGGVARFAKGVARTAKGTADSVVANQKDAPADDRTTTDKAQDAAVAGASAAGDALVAGKRREWAQKVGADPYTTNQQLSDKLDEVAWTAYAGGFALNFAVPTIPGLGMVETADKLVYDLPPGELQKRNDDKLKAAGVTDAARKALFVNRNFTPTIETELVDAIEALGTASGKSLLVSLAAESKTEGDARYIRRCVQMLAAGAKEVGGFRAFTTSRNEIEAVTPDFRLVLPWAVGYMTWNAETVPVMTPPVQAAAKREVWISGVATDRAKRELLAKGFAVVEKRSVR